MKRSLNIAFVLDDSLDRPDGVQQYILTLGKWLSARGHHVHYLVGETRRTDLLNVHSLAKNVRVRFNKNQMSIPLPTSRSKIKEKMQALQLDILHVQMPYNPLFAARVIEACGDTTAVFGTFHILPNSNVEHRATRLLARWLKRSLARFDTVYGVSKPACEFARDAFGVSATVMPNVVDIAAIQKASPHVSEDGTVTIMFLGRLVERKGCGHLLKALAALPPELQSRINVIICGGGPLEAKLKNFVEQHKLVSIVRFAGFVSETEKSEYLAGADIAVFPATGGESFGIVLIEAMAAGAGVVLGGDNPGYRSVLRDDKVLFNPRNTELFASTLKRFITDASLRERLHKAQSALVREYDIAEVGPRIEADYQSMIAKRRNN